MKYLNQSKLEQLITENAEADVAAKRLGEAEIIVNQCGKRVFHGFFGGAKANAVYRIASMTKPVTAAVLLRAVDEGLVGMFDPVRRYLPAYGEMTVGHVENGRVVPDRAAEGVIRMFMTVSHTSGIVSGEIESHLRQWHTFRTMRDTVDYYASEPLMFDPDTAWGYSTPGFDVAATVVEMTSGVPYVDYLQEKLLRPLGMADTVFAPSPEQWKRFVPVSGHDEAGNIVGVPQTEGCVYEDHAPSICSCGAGLASTAEDYSRFAEMLCSGGLAPDGQRILSEKAVRAMRTPVIPESRMDHWERWGLGVRVVTRPDYPHGLPVGAFGWSGAFGSHFWVDPVNRITAVYMKNSLFDGGAGTMTGNRFEETVSAALE